MKILITGASQGIGRAIAEKFLKEGHEVVGMDIKPAGIVHANYSHVVQDVTEDPLPEIPGCEILVHSAGVQLSGRDIEVNLMGTIHVTEHYVFGRGASEDFKPSIRSVLLIASASAQTGSEFPEYAASKGGVVTYMKNVALRMAPNGGIANSLSPGGVTTELNRHVMEDPSLWEQIMDETPLRKWASPEEIADWAYFVSAVNRSMTAQDLLIDNGEAARANFVW